VLHKLNFDVVGRFSNVFVVNITLGVASEMIKFF